MEGKTWAEDVSPYGIMLKAHDLWQLGRLKSLIFSCRRFFGRYLI